MDNVKALVALGQTIRHGRQQARRKHGKDVEIRTEIYGPVGSELIKHVPVPKKPDTIQRLDSAA